MIRFFVTCIQTFAGYWGRVDTRLTVLENDMATAHELIGQLVEKNRTLDTVVGGVGTTLTTMSAALKEALNNVVSTGDTALLQDVISGIDSNIQELSSSIAANTSAASEPASPAPAPVTTDTPLTSNAASTADAAPAPEAAPAPTDAAPAAETSTETPAPTAETPNS